jgi:hypothetical protein
VTTAWAIPSDMWRGETVAVLAPGLTEELAELFRTNKTIAVRRAFEVAPWADMLISLDGPTGSLDDDFWNDAADFAGMKVCGLECEVDALYPGMMYETVVMGPAHSIEIRNNGLAAVRLAARAGAAKILLVNFDTERYERNHGFSGLTEGLAALITELRVQGVEVEIVDAGR